MFHFPGCPPHKLLIHLWVTGHYPSRVPPFGYPWIKAYLQLPMAFRSLSRPSSAISALASTLRSYSLDLASSVSIAFLRLLRCDTYFDLCFPVSSAPLLTGIFRFTVSTFAEISFFFPVQFSRCAGLSPGPICCRRSFPAGPALTASRRRWTAFAFGLEVSHFHANPQNDTDKRFF